MIIQNIHHIIYSIYRFFSTDGENVIFSISSYCCDFVSSFKREKKINDTDMFYFKTFFLVGIIF